MNACRVRLVGLLAMTVLCSGCFAVRLPPLTNYSLPKTKNITLATCYGSLSVGSDERAKSSLPEADQQKIDYIDAGLQRSLEQAGYKISRIGCDEAWTTQEHSIKLTLLFTVWSYALINEPDAIEFYAYTIPWDMKTSKRAKPVPVSHEYYGSPYKKIPTAKEILPKIETAVKGAIKQMQHNSLKQ